MIIETLETAMVIALAALLLLFLRRQNNCITVTQIRYANDTVPAEFNNYKVLLISDLHNKASGGVSKSCSI